MRSARAASIVAGLQLFLPMAVAAVDASRSEIEACLICHSDSGLTRAGGEKLLVPDALATSVHAALSCVDCHAEGNFDDVPHAPKYTPVDCAGCHAEVAEQWSGSVHGRGPPAKRIGCVQCHESGDDPHDVRPAAGLDPARVCVRCHPEETQRFASGGHAKAISAMSPPGCAGCHRPHAEASLSNAGSTRVCEPCHASAAEKLRGGPHGLKEAIPQRTKDAPKEQVGCSSCHEPHAMPDPVRSSDAFSQCVSCHRKSVVDFAGSVHEARLRGGEMTCASCHSIHLEPGQVAFHCGDCHEKANEEYRQSAHFKQNPTGLGAAANCGDCHNRGHQVRSAGDPQAMTHFANQPKMCGKCHGESLVVAPNYVRLPMTLSNYRKSVHYERLLEWEQDPSKPRGAVCTDCHESHLVRSAGDTASVSNRMRVADTCGKCHPKQSRDYQTSVHGAALAHGLTDTPACPDCHDSHMILSQYDPLSRTFEPSVSADCGQCHESRSLTDRFGIWPGVVKSYRDSYHGWAIGKQTTVANCTDCHTTHRIRSHLDPTSTTYPKNVVRTCGRCHENSNEEFATSYTHASFGQIWGVHDVVRVVYIVLIIAVLTGMVAHNTLILSHTIRKHYLSHLEEEHVLRMNRTEVLQHILLIVTFTGLAVTGFALRFPESWWVRALRWAGMDEGVRAASHRVFAALLVAGTVWHALWMVLSRRGRAKLAAYLPAWQDVASARETVRYYFGMRDEKPGFGVYDYTQKAEYWALVWGTIVMGLTGFVLWFPSLMTSWSPGWTVRVSEVVHYYEAILAVGAILVWHFFFVIYHPKVYPVSLTFVTGRMPLHEWKEDHSLADPLPDGDHEGASGGETRGRDQ
ncbi:MAG: cytochrome b/b6 domain-containing protein [Acidobacteriota bacterium]